METQLFNTIKTKAQPLAEQVADQISQLIIDRHLPVNNKLPNEFELAEQLHVGRGTIREAVKLLVARNVLVIKRGRGTFVAKHPGVVDDPFGFAYISDNIKLAADLLEMRLLIEPWAARTAAERATKKDIEKLTAANEAINEKIYNQEDYTSEDERFHVTLAHCTQSLVLPKIIPVIIYSVHQLKPITSSSEDFQQLREATIATHKKILDAITNHEPQAAKEAMIEHLTYNLQAVEKKKK